MSSPCRTKAGLAALGLLAALCACDEHRQQEARNASASPQEPRPVILSELAPGGEKRTEDPRGQAYDGNAYHVAQGKQYFSAYHCDGCHFNGGGGIGPPFMDKVWSYGGDIDDIYHSIADGRPNGMPTWRAMIPEDRIWELAAYVRSLSTPQVKGDDAPEQPPSNVPPPPHPDQQGGTLISEATVGSRPQ